MQRTTSRAGRKISMISMLNLQLRPVSLAIPNLVFR